MDLSKLISQGGTGAAPWTQSAVVAICAVAGYAIWKKNPFVGAIAGGVIGFVGWTVYNGKPKIEKSKS